MANVIERVTLDPATEDATLQPLDLAGLDPSWGIYLLEHSYPAPEQDKVYAGTSDAEGDVLVQSRYKNRTIPIRVRVVEPSDLAATNLVTNPSFETGVAEWLADGSATKNDFSRSAAWSYANGSGDYSAHAKYTATGVNQNARLWHKTSGGSASMPVTPGKTYTASVVVNVLALTAGGKGPRLYIRWLNAANSGIGDGSAVSSQVNALGVTRLSFSATAPAEAASAALMVGYYTNDELTTGDVVEFYVDAAQFEEGAAATAYFDGDSPGCDWTGTHHASTSTRPPPDGTRFSRIVRELTRRIDRIKRQRYGFLRRESALGETPLVYDLVGAELTDAPQDLGISRRRAELALTFEAEPGGRGPEVLVASKEETTLPSLALTAAVPGEMSALGRLVVTEKQGQLQRGLLWGLEQRYYSAAATAELFYQAEGRTLLSGATSTALAESSGGNAAFLGTLVNSYQPILSTQATGGGAHHSHIGTYRVIARTFRPTTNTGEVTVQLQWREGDFVSVSENEPVSYGIDDREGTFCLTDLGEVTVEPPPPGTTSRWEGRIQAKSTASGDDIYVDCYFLIPVVEGSGEAVAPFNTGVGALLGYDGFDYGTEAALAAKVAPLGGTWGGGGDADDFKVGPSTGAGYYNLAAFRTGMAAPDTEKLGRFEWLSETARTNVEVTTNLISWTIPYELVITYAFHVMAGVFARYVATENQYLAALLECYSGANGLAWWRVGIWKKIGGTKTLLGSVPLGGWNGYFNLNVGITLIVNGTTWICVVTPGSGIWNVAQAGQASGTDAVLGTTLASGRCGIYHEQNTVTEWPPEKGPAFLDFSIREANLDAAMFASRQLELRSDRIRRQDSGGVTWGKPPYEGDYLTLPPAGPEGLTSRVFVKGSRSPWDGDSGIDDIKADLYATPRYLLAPPT